MQQYLFNATMIWLACLLTFELLFRKETFHRWNRAYLLASLAGGLLLPLIDLSQVIHYSASSPAQSDALRRIVIVRQRLAQHSYAGVASTTNNWLLLIYLAGVAGAVTLLGRETLRLVQLYKNGRKRVQDGFTIIVTNAGHAPFSFLRFVFISSLGDYTIEEQRMMLRHEFRHGLLLHSFDLTVVRLVQCVLWFHPCMYWFRKRLQLVHEYQADAIARTDFSTYGMFLLEQQSLRMPAHLLTHSFLHSPLKNRIIMLTKTTSSKWHLLKYLLALPLAGTLLFACTHADNKAPAVETASKPATQGGKVMFKGNEFEMSNNAPDQIVVVNPETSKTDTIVMSITPHPVKMNGVAIQAAPQVKPTLSGEGLLSQLRAKYPDAFNALEDGEYNVYMEAIVVDEQGKAVYYTRPDIVNPARTTSFIMKDDKTATVTGPNNPAVTATKESPEQKNLADIIYDALDKDLHFAPGQQNGKAVIAAYEPESMRVRVKNHKAEIVMNSDASAMAVSAE